MKIINRLYFKIIFIAITLIGTLVAFYNMKHSFQTTLREKEKKIDRFHEQLFICKQKVQDLNKFNKTLKYAQQQTQHLLEYQLQNKVHTKQKKMQQEKIDFKKLLMYSIHKQLIQELQYAPYLSIAQLANIIKQRFTLEGITLKIHIDENNKKKFQGIIIQGSTTKSIIRNNALLEVVFVTK